MLLIFGAERWCGPCRAMHKLIKKYAETHPGFVFEFRDVDETAHHEEAVSRGVAGIPTMLVMDGETEIRRHSGQLSVDDFDKFVKGTS